MTRIRRSIRERRTSGLRSSTRLRLAGLAAALAVTWLSLAGPVGSATAATSPEPPVTAWWTAANLGSGVAIPGAVLGASGKQLLVEGSNALPPVSAVSNAPVSSLAVAALRWQLGPGQAAASLTVPIAGSPPPFVTVEACQVTSGFAPAYGGPYADVPSYSCAHAVDGRVKGGALVFAGIGKLAAGDMLSILLLPGSLDRVVFAPPSVHSLVLTGPAAPHPQHTCACLPSTGPPPGPGAGAGPGGASGPGPLPTILPPTPQIGPAASPPPPVVAGATGGGPTQPVALTQSLPRWHRWLATGVIALEVVVFVAMQRRRSAAATPGRGIGRFVTEREAPPIRL